MKLPLYLSIILLSEILLISFLLTVTYNTFQYIERESALIPNCTPKPEETRGGPILEVPVMAPLFTEEEIRALNAKEI